MQPVCAPRTAGAHTGSDAVFPPRDTPPIPLVDTRNPISVSREKLSGKIPIASAVPAAGQRLRSVCFVDCQMRTGQGAPMMRRS